MSKGETVAKNQLSDENFQDDEAAKPPVGRMTRDEKKALEQELIKAHPTLSIDSIQVLIREEDWKRKSSNNIRVIESKGEKGNMVSTRLSPEIFAKLNVLASSTGLSLSALTRLAVGELIMGFEARRGKPIEWDKVTRDPADKD